MKRSAIYLLLLSITFAACKEPGRKEMILGKWRSVKIENRDKDEFFRSSLKFIDTMGQSNDDKTNMEIYGVTNMDSLRKELRVQYDSAYAAQMSIDTQSTFSFREDGVIVFGFPGKSEEGKWNINDKGQLQLEEMNENGQTEKVDVDIAELSADNLKLVFTRDLGDGSEKDTSVVSFRREKN